MIPTSFRPQLYVLNLLAAALVVATIVLPTWHLVVALVAVLGATCFRWTREPEARDTVAQDDRLAKLEAQVGRVDQGLGKLKFKIGLKGD